MAPLLIAALAGGGLGLLKGAQNEKKMQEHDKFRKAAITYSPWTGMGDPGQLNLPDTLSSSLSGAATGAMIGSMMPGSENTSDPNSLLKWQIMQSQSRGGTPTAMP